MTKTYTLADATDARHLADARMIVRENKQRAREAVQFAQWHLARCKRLLSMAKGTENADTISLYRADVDAAVTKLESARVKYAAI